MAVLTLAYLRGVWRARRTINGDPDAFRGLARFTPDGDGELFWEEEGRLRLGGHEGPARRGLRIGRDGVRFEDGRAFHPFREGELEHLCAPDVYRGRWTVHGPDRFTLIWTVSGPGREDRIACEYERLREGDVTESPAAHNTGHEH